MQSTSDSKMASAHKRVLGIPELLEFIILELPVRDIFIGQRVSRHSEAHWHDLVRRVLESR